MFDSSSSEKSKIHVSCSCDNVRNVFEAATPKADRLEAEEENIDISRCSPGGADAAAGKTGIAGRQREQSAGPSTAEDPCAQHAISAGAASAAVGRIRSLDEIIEEIAYMQTVDENAGISVPSSPWICVSPRGNRKPLIPWTERLARRRRSKNSSVFARAETQRVKQACARSTWSRPETHRVKQARARSTRSRLAQRVQHARARPKINARSTRSRMTQRAQ